MGMRSTTRTHRITDMEASMNPASDSKSRSARRTAGTGRRSGNPYALAVAAFLACAAPAGAALAAEVGWVQLQSASALPHPVKVVSKGVDRPYYPETGLAPCDEVRLMDPSVTALVTLANGTHQRLDGKKSRFIVPCDSQSVGAELLDFFKRTLGLGEAKALRPTAATSREPKPYPTPVTRGDVSRFVAGHRALLVLWEGGASPFTVEISRHDDGRVVAAARGVAERSVRLPAADYPPGRYVLLIEGQNGKGMKDDELYAMPESQLPPMPKPLADAPMAAQARTALYARFLGDKEGGEWTLEAVQRAAETEGTGAWRDYWLGR